MLSYTEKQQLGELLSILLDDNDFVQYANQINDKTVRYAEDLLQRFTFCNRATSALFAGIKCIPKSANVYGWLLSCGHAVIGAMIDIIRANHSVLYSNMLCTTGIHTHRDAIKATLLDAY